MSKKMNSQVQFLLERPNPALGRIIPFETQEYKGGIVEGGSVGSVARKVGKFVKRKAIQNLEMPIKVWKYQLDAINKATDKIFPLHKQLTKVGGATKRKCKC